MIYEINLTKHFHRSIFMFENGDDTKSLIIHYGAVKTTMVHNNRQGTEYKRV